MSDFRSPSEEVLRLLHEIETTQASLREIASRLSATEKHVRRAFQIPKVSRSTKKLADGLHAAASDRATLLAVFDRVRNVYSADETTESTRTLSELSEIDLRALARELGISSQRKASVRKVQERILQKARESSLLGGDTSLRGSEESTRANALVLHLPDESQRDEA